MTFLVTAAVGSVTTAFIVREQRVAREEMQAQAQLFLSSLAVASSDALYFSDTNKLSDIARRLEQTPNLLFARFYDREGRLIGDASNAASVQSFEIDPLGRQLLQSEAITYRWESQQLVAGQAIILGRMPQGAISISLSTAPLQARIAAIRREGISAALLASAVGALFSLLFSRTIASPIKELAAATTQFGEDELEFSADGNRSDEIGELSRSFSLMELRVRQRTEELAQVNEEMDLADEVARIMTSTLNIDEVYEKFALELKKLVDFDRASINVIDQEASTATLKYLFGPARPGHTVGTVNSIQGSENQTVLATGQILLRKDVTAVRYAADLGHARNGLRSTVRVPLISKGRIIGTLSLRSKQVDAYGPREQAILERLATQIAPALENARLHEEQIEAEQEMALADEVGRIVTTTLNIDEVYEKFALELKKLVDFERINIKLVDLEANNYTLKYLFGPARDGHPVGTVEPLENSQTLQVAVTQRTLIEDDVGVNPTFRTDHYFSSIGLPANITVPLLIGDHVNGTLSLRSRQVGAYGPREQAILERLATQIAPALENARLYEEQIQTDQELRTSEGRLRTLMENMPDGVLLVVGGKIIYINPALSTILGYENAHYLGQSPLILLHPEEQERAGHCMGQILGGAPRSPEEYRGCNKDGSIVPLEISCRLIEYGGEPALLSVLRDLTERKRMEEQLSHAQKMETVGRLAGGVAHDFNNLLTAIMGYSQMSLQEAPPESAISNHLQEVTKAAERAASLTGQLLAFSRRQVIEPRVIDLNDLVINLDKMLRRLIGEDIELVTLPASNLEPVRADPGQMDQVLVNLAVNARDAMPTGGKLTIETANITLDAEYVQLHGDASSGRHVLLAVSDTGMGMSKEVQDRIFEPFFTTTDVGKGTGLGLATCYGIVQQSGGHMEVSSEPDQGTSFKVYLPVTAESRGAEH